MKSLIDVELKTYATVRQAEYIDAIIECGSQRKAAKKLGIGATVIDQAITSIKRKAASKGYSPDHDMTRTVPTPFIVKGISTYYNAEGVPSGQWVKSSLDNEKFQQIMFETIESMKEDIPRIKMTKQPPLGNSSLLNCYVITDYHMGMLAWHEETGDDWDIKIAEDLLIKWFAQAIHQSPDADTAIFAQLSDFLHFDGMDAVTPASKHLLDADTRFSKLVRAVIRVLRIVITMLLQKHQNLHIIMADANHDPVSQIWLREWFSVM